jgi:hypothetical protein
VIAFPIGGDRWAVSPRLATESRAILGPVDDGEIEGLVAWLAARTEPARDEDLGEGCEVDVISANSESSHALDDVFASLSNEFWLF